MVQLVAEELLGLNTTVMGTGAVQRPGDAVAAGAGGGGGGGA